MSKPARIIIGLYGSKGVGKNFVADILINYVALEAQEVYAATDAFAEPIKQFAMNALGLPNDACYGSDQAKMALTDYEWGGMPFKHEKSGKMTAREVMQVVGTELGRETWGDKMWINALGYRAHRFFDEAADDIPAIYVVTDVRFDNEVEGIKEMGGLVWRVQGPQRIGESSKGDAHASELQRDDMECDGTIVNEEGTSKGDIKKQITKLLKDVDWFGKVEEA
jgi:hypothetical protein